ncbi:MAG: M28 family peptidase [Bacteroidia bacterium]|nr:M28 family peptidase [Bacteroidia bacterium]
MSLDNIRKIQYYEKVHYFGRNAGTIYDRMTGIYIKDKLIEYGMQEVWIDTFELCNWQWFPDEMELTLIGGSSPGVPLQDTIFEHIISVGSNNTSISGIEGELIYANLCEPSDLAGLDLTERIVLVRTLPDMQHPLDSSQKNFFHHTIMDNIGNITGGAYGIPVGIIVIPWLAGAPLDLNVAKTNGNCNGIPNLQISYGEGAYLINVIQSSGADLPNVRMNIQGQWGKYGLYTQNVIGSLQGNGVSDKWIIFQAHIDGYLSAANDNASGLAALLDLARHYGQINQFERNYNMMFVATAAHHNGPGCGSTTFSQMYDTILIKTERIFNIEHIASNSLYPDDTVMHVLFVTDMNPDIINYWQEGFTLFGDNLKICLTISDGYQADLFPYETLNVPASMLFEPYFFWYHTNHDTPENISPDHIESVTKIYAFVTDKLNEELSTSIPSPQDIRNKMSAFPNPFNSETTISFPKFDNKSYILTITDMRGNQIGTYNKINTKRITITGKNLPDGVYYCHLFNEDGYIISYKLVKN